MSDSNMPEIQAIGESKPKRDMSATGGYVSSPIPIQFDNSFILPHRYIPISRSFETSSGKIISCIIVGVDTYPKWEANADDQ